MLGFESEHEEFESEAMRARKLMKGFQDGHDVVRMRVREKDFNHLHFR